MRRLNPYQITNDASSQVVLEDAKPKASSKNKLSEKVGTLTTPLVILVSILAILWIVELVDSIFATLALCYDRSLDTFGIRTRQVDQLWRILVAPFLHADYSHLIANSIPLLVLGYLVMIRNKWHFPVVFVIAVLVSGMGVWLFAGANSIHIGASGRVWLHGLSTGARFLRTEHCIHSVRLRRPAAIWQHTRRRAARTGWGIVAGTSVRLDRRSPGRLHFQPAQTTQKAAETPSTPKQ